MPWIIIWIFLSVFILGIFIWTVEILFRQKRAWHKFARKNNLKYEQGALLQSPAVKGRLGDYEFMLFSEEQQNPRHRGRQFRTVLQFSLPPGMPAGGMFATSDYHDFADSLDLPYKIPVKAQNWKAANIARSQKKNGLSSYLSQERIEAMTKLASFKNASMLFIFDENETIVRLETLDPLQDNAKIDRITKKILPNLDVLALEKSEQQISPTDSPSPEESRDKISTSEEDAKQSEPGGSDSSETSSENETSAHTVPNTESNKDNAIEGESAPPRENDQESGKS